MASAWEAYKKAHTKKPGETSSATDSTASAASGGAFSPSPALPKRPSAWEEYKSTHKMVRPSLNPARYDDSWKRTNDVSDFDFSGNDLALDNTTDYNRLAELKIAADREAERNKYAVAALGGGGKSTSAKTAYETYLAEHTIPSEQKKVYTSENSLVYQMLKDRAEAEKRQQSLPGTQRVQGLDPSQMGSLSGFADAFKSVAGTPAQDAFDDFRRRNIDYNSYLNAADFEEYSKKGAEIQNPSFEEAQGGANIFGWRPGAADVGNIVTFSRDNLDKIKDRMESDDRSQFIGNALYGEMTEDQVKIYNYILAKEGKEAAQIYLDSIAETLNEEYGKKVAATVESTRGTALHPIMVAGTATSAGLDQYIGGVKQAFNEYELPTSGIQYAGQAVREDQGVVGKFAYDAISTLSNMAPSILASYIAMGLGVPAKAAEWVAAGSIGLGSGGNAYKQALAEGRSKEEAQNVAALIGASEAVLSKLLSGISAVGGLAPEKLLPKVAAIEKGLRRVAAAAGVKLGGEISEEVLQLYLEPLYKTLIYGDKYDAPTVEEVAYTALLTLVTTGLVEGGEIAKYRTKEGAAEAVRAELQEDAQSVPVGVSDDSNAPGGGQAQNAPAAPQTEQKKATTGLRDPMQVLMEENRKAQAQQNEKTAAETQRSVSEESTEARAPGFYKNDRFGGTDEDAKYLDRLAKAAGISIEMAEDRAGSNGWIVNGEVHLSEKAEDPLRVVAKHEITHHLQDAAGDAYSQYRNYVEQIYREEGSLDRTIEELQRNYRKNGKWLSREAALDELAADYAGELMDNESLIRKLAGENRNIAQRILDGIRDLIRRVKTAFGGDEVKQLDRAARLWEIALKETNAAYQRGEVINNPEVRNQAIWKTTRNETFVEIEEDILDGISDEDRVTTVKEALQKKFPDGITVGNNEIQIDYQSRKELTFSKYMKWLYNNDQQLYEDKLRSTNNADEILHAATGWVNEGLKHSRKDNIVDFARGTVLLRVGSNDYSADVVVGTRKNGTMLLYDILDLQPTSFEKKETDVAKAENPSPGTNRNATPVSESTVPQERQSVKGSRDLQKQIRALERQNQRLKEQMKRTDIPQQNRNAVENTANALAKEYSSKIDRKALADRLETLYDSIYQKSENKGIWSGKNVLTWEEIRAETRSIANDILDQSTAYASPLYREYGKLRGQIRNEALTIAAKDREELQYFGYDGYEDFKKRNAKRLTLTEDGRSVESLYRELNEENPELFPDDMFTPAEQLNRINEVLTDLDALAQDPHAFDRDNTVEFLAGEIEERFYQTERKELTFADKEEQKRQKMRQSDKRLFDAELYAVGRKHEREVKAVQQRYAEANRKRIENQNAAQRRETIYRHANRLANKLLRPTNKQHVPEELRGAAYNLLKYINLESGYELSYGKGATYRRVLKGTELDAEPNSRTLAAIELKKKLEEMAGKENMTIDPDMGDYLSEIALMGNKTLQQMTRAELDTVWKVIQIVEHTINRANELHEQGRYESLSAMARALAQAIKYKAERKDYVKAVGALDKLINFDMLSPETFFHKLGKPGDEIYRMMRRAADRQTGIYNEGVSKAQELIKESGADFTKLDKEFHEFDFGGKRKITLSKSQIMELYALSRREQARAHIEEGGLKAVSAAKGFVEQGNVQPVKVSWNEVEQITSKLTDKEKKLVEGLQAYLSNELSKHGNEETMKVYGYEKFKEKFYWPIKVSGTETESSPSKAAHAKTIPGYGMTKNVEPDASNAVELHSAIDTFSNHLNQMATYAAWLGTNEDITRLINFQYDSVENGTENTVKRILATVYGKNGEKYINDLLSDIAQGTKAGQDRTLSDNLTSQWKAAKVGGNLRVIVQQPTAILRAMTMLDPKYMVANANAKAGWEKAKKYAPIAQWKDWGYFEIGTGRSLRELIVGTESGIDKIKNSLMWAAGAMDSVSWGYLWNAVERETADKHPDLTKGSEDFYKAVADRFSEIIDRTQVVDSVLHRTQIMRSGNALNKMATSFMSEPSKIYNMVARDLYDIVDADSETAKKRAYKALRRSSGALIASFAVNALMQSLVDALRDDDRDKGYWEKLAENYFGITGDEESFAEYYKNFWSGNFWQNFNPLSYVPYVKDVLSIAQGYEVDRSDMAAISDLANALQQLGKSISGEGQKSLLATGMDAAAKLGDLLGIPVSNVKRDVAAALNTVLNGLELYEVQYALDKIVYNEEKASGVFFGDLYRTMNNDYEAYEDIYDDMYEGMIERGYEEDEAADKISDAMENKMKKDLGVESVKSMPVRYSSPTTADKEDPFYALLKKARENDTNWVEALDPGSIEIALAVDSIRDAKTLEKIRMVAEQPYGEDLKRLAMRNFMGDSQWGRYLSALNAGVSSKQFAEFLEAIATEAQRRTGKEDANPSQADILAVLEKSKLNSKQKRAIWNGYGWKAESPW